MSGPLTNTTPSALTASVMKELSERLQDLGMHAPMGSALESAQAIDALGKLAQSAKLLIAGRQLMTSVKNVFDRLPALSFVDLTFHSSAYDIRDGAAGYHDADLVVLRADGEEADKVEASLLSEGLVPEVLRTLMNVGDLEDGHFTLSVSRHMLEGRPTPERLAEACFQAMPDFEKEVLNGFGYDLGLSPAPQVAPQAAPPARQRFA